MSYAARSLVIGEEIMYVDGRRALETPIDILRDPKQFTRTLVKAARFHNVDEMTVILEADAARVLGLPPNLPRAEKAAVEHKLLRTWREDGWFVSRLSPWFTLWRPGIPSIHFGVLPWLSKTTNFFHSEDSCQLGWRLWRFHALTGAAFHGTPGLAATTILRDKWPGTKGEPDWKPKWDHITPANADVEGPYVGWTGKAEGLPYRHRIDARRQYLAAAWNTRAAMGPLRHTPFQEWSKAVFGYWLINVPHFNDSRVPHPVADAVPGTQHWVTSPTMELLAELSAQGFMTMPTVLDSYTTDRGIKDLFRPWVTRIEESYQASYVPPTEDPLPELPVDATIVRNAIKSIYKQGIGMMHVKNSRVHRPDWHHSIIAKARVNLWRKVWGVGLFSDRWPVSVDYDAVVYESNFPEYTDDQPRMFVHKLGRPDVAFPLEDKRGGFEHKETEKVEE